MTFWYLATPYTRYPHGREQAYRDACRWTAQIIRAGIAVVSPIAHSHGLAEHGGMPVDDHDLWMRLDAPLMAAAKGCIVIQADGWQDSRGVAHEIEVFRAAGKPVLFVSLDGNDVGISHIPRKAA